MLHKVIFTFQRFCHHVSVSFSFSCLFSVDSLYTLQHFLCMCCIYIHILMYIYIYMNMLYSYLLDSYVLHYFLPLFYLYYQSIIDHKIKKTWFLNTSFNKILVYFRTFSQKLGKDEKSQPGH